MKFNYFIFIIENKAFYNISFNEILQNPITINPQCLQGKMKVMTFFAIGENLCLQKTDDLQCRNEVKKF